MLANLLLACFNLVASPVCVYSAFAHNTQGGLPGE